MKRALVVIDAQNEYVSGRLPIGYPEVGSSIARIGEAMDAAQQRGIPVVVVQHAEPEDSPVFARGSDGFELVPAIAGRPLDLRIEKTFPSSFTGTSLEEFLHAQGVDTLVITGYMTQHCCDSTARDAVHRGFGVEFLSDATGTLALSNELGSLTAEQLHTAVLVVMQSDFAAVMPTASWIASLETGTPVAGSDLLSSTADAVQA
ncbi:cysteine hydrolase family protein [Naasia lichenicola]|uniref:Cysteine hydrolase n=1 Tax=Naasia lichenicola TaxID=2565933 RepID=A0A4S4FKW2_9MICO|nr:cysteine hydrolase family protein [Naasia lichenicola]THG31083.1 cysteine hydrolase [Naasia lichenicola]